MAGFPDNEDSTKPLPVNSLSENLHRLRVRADWARQAVPRENVDTPKPAVTARVGCGQRPPATPAQDLQSVLAQTNEILRKEIEVRRCVEELLAVQLQIAELSMSDVSMEDFYQQVHRLVSRLLIADNFTVALRSWSTE